MRACVRVHVCVFVRACVYVYVYISGPEAVRLPALVALAVRHGDRVSHLAVDSFQEASVRSVPLHQFEHSVGLRNWKREEKVISLLNLTMNNAE